MGGATSTCVLFPPSFTFAGFFELCGYERAVRFLDCGAVRSFWDDLSLIGKESVSVGAAPRMAGDVTPAPMVYSFWDGV